jgi:hypothetical protein
MKSGVGKLSPLRQAALLCLGVVLGSGALVAHALYALDAARATEQVAREGLHAVEARLHAAPPRAEEILAGNELLQQLSARGVIGNERRHTWIALLSQLRATHQPAELHYELAPRQRLAALSLPANKMPGLDVYLSRMKLQLNVLHEDDLLLLLDELVRQAPALLRIPHCQIDRLETATRTFVTALQPRLRVECRLEWITAQIPA